MLHAWDQVLAALGRRPPGGTSARALVLRDAGTRGERQPRPGPAELLIVGAYLAAALIVTFHLWADPASRTVAGNPDDADLFSWYMRYAATAIAHGHLPALTSTAMNAPWGVNLTWNSSLLVPCVLLAPVTLLLGPQVSLTILTTAGFAGSAAALFIVLRRWNVSRTASAMAGAAYGFSPALVHSAIGHYNLQLAVLPPLIIDAGLRLVTSPDDGLLAAARRGGWLGLLVGMQLFVSEELALTTACTGVLLLAVLATGFPLPPVRRVALAAAGLGAAAAVTMIIAGWALLTQFTGSLTQQGSPFLRDYYVNDLTGFVTPSQYLFFHTAGTAAAAARYQGQAPEYLGYLGWPLIIVLAVAAAVYWRRPVVRSLAITFVVLEVFSLGGHPLFGGTSHPHVPLPWHWIEGLPLAGSVLPGRWSILADGVAASLLAITLDLARSRWSAELAGKPVTARGIRPAMLLAVGVLACLPMLPRPLPAARPAALPAGWHATLAALRLTAGARVLIVPVPQVHLTDAMRWQADTSQDYSLIGGYFIGPAWDGHAYVDGNGLRPTAVYLDKLWAAGLGPSRLAAASVAAAGLPALGAAPSAAQTRADLAAWKPAAVLAVTTPGSRLGRYLTELLGAPRFRFGHVLAWRR